MLTALIPTATPKTIQTIQLHGGRKREYVLRLSLIKRISKKRPTIRGRTGSIWGAGRNSARNSSNKSRSTSTKEKRGTWIDMIENCGFLKPFFSYDDETSTRSTSWRKIGTPMKAFPAKAVGMHFQPFRLQGAEQTDAPLVALQNNHRAVVSKQNHIPIQHQKLGWREERIHSDEHIT